jgi:ribosomal protein L23
VSPRANKREIAQAVASVYGVTPAGVRVVPIPSKAIRNARTGKSGVKPGGKKAYVYLKAGDTITL